MKTKIKIIISSILAIGVVFSIYAAAQLTKLKDLDILDISNNEEDWF